MADVEDDYMSDLLLSNIEDVKPGIANREQQRYLKIMANRDAAEQNKPLKKRELEKNLLEEGLNQPICTQSKGFALLSKMGFKPGMSLGKKREGLPEGIKEPVAIEIKTGRTGLGHDIQEKEKQKERCEMHLEEMLGKQIPECEWFWPIYKSKDNQDFETSEQALLFHARSKRLKIDDYEELEETEEELRHFYVNGKDAPEELNYYEFKESDLEIRLNRLVNYVRETHCYCVWCGSSFESMEELAQQCPGTTRQEHDDHDE